MDKTFRWLSFALLALALGSAFSCTPRAIGPAETDVAAPLRYVRIHTDAGGVSHFADEELVFTLLDFAPPAPPISVAEVVDANGVAVLSSPAGWHGDWHPSPRRQLMFVLDGELEVQVSDGETRRFRTGTNSMLLVEDTTGKGHISTVVGTDRAHMVSIPLSGDPEAGDSALHRPSSDRSTEVEAIQELLSTAGDAVNAGDVAAEIGRFTEDGIYMWPDVPSIEGREALQEWFQNRFAAVDVRLESTTEEIEVFGDWAFERGSYVAHIRPKGTEEAETLRGKHLNILRRQPDGSWRIARRMRNRDHPAKQNSRDEERGVRDEY
jgi:uncharacterized protein (TIGR02246 family)